MNTYINVLKYIEKIFKVPTSVYFEDTINDNTKKPVENLESTKEP